MSDDDLTGGPARYLTRVFFLWSPEFVVSGETADFAPRMELVCPPCQNNALYTGMRWEVGIEELKGDNKKVGGGKRGNCSCCRCHNAPRSRPPLNLKHWNPDIFLCCCVYDALLFVRFPPKLVKTLKRGDARWGIARERASKRWSLFFFYFFFLSSLRPFFSENYWAASACFCFFCGAVVSVLCVCVCVFLFSLELRPHMIEHAHPAWPPATPPGTRDQSSISSRVSSEVRRSRACCAVGRAAGS